MNKSKFLHNFSFICKDGSPKIRVLQFLINISLAEIFYQLGVAMCLQMITYARVKQISIFGSQQQWDGASLEYPNDLLKSNVSFIVSSRIFKLQQNEYFLAQTSTCMTLRPLIKFMAVHQIQNKSTLRQ